VGKCAALVSEELVLDECGLEARATHRHEWELRSLAKIMNRTRDQLFSSSCLAENQNRRLGLSDGRQLRDGSEEGRRRTDKIRSLTKGFKFGQRWTEHRRLRYESKSWHQSAEPAVHRMPLRKEFRITDWNSPRSIRASQPASVMNSLSVSCKRSVGGV